MKELKLEEVIAEAKKLNFKLVFFDGQLYWTENPLKDDSSCYAKVFKNCSTCEKLKEEDRDITMTEIHIGGYEFRRTNFPLHYCPTCGRFIR